MDSDSQVRRKVHPVARAHEGARRGSRGFSLAHLYAVRWEDIRRGVAMLQVRARARARASVKVRARVRVRVRTHVAAWPWCRSASQRGCARSTCPTPTPTLNQECFPARLCTIYVLHEPRWLLLLVRLLWPLLSQEP